MGGFGLAVNRVDGERKGFECGWIWIRQLGAGAVGNTIRNYDYVHASPGGAIGRLTFFLPPTMDLSPISSSSHFSIETTLIPTTDQIAEECPR